MAATGTFYKTFSPIQWSLISKKLEELGIGCPSTYAPTISTIQKERICRKSDKEGTSRIFRVLVLKDDKISKTKEKEILAQKKPKCFPPIWDWLLPIS